MTLICVKEGEPQILRPRPSGFAQDGTSLIVGVGTDWRSSLLESRHSAFRTVVADHRRLLYSRRMALKRMDNVGIVVEDLGGAIEFFQELGLELEGRATIEGEWAGRVTGLAGQRVEIAMMRTPDGHSRLELSRFLAPGVAADHRNAPVNALGYLRVMFAVDDIDETLGRLLKRGAQLVGEVVRYQDSYRLCYIRGPEGILIGLAQELN
jgi:catechol 2,3-dioxygenase-like lactoylglutathione lyase family enzyme